MIVSFQKLLYIRYRYLYRCSSALAAGDIKLAVAHHIKPLTDIIKRDVRLVVVDRVVSRTVVLHDYLARGFCFSRDDRDVDRVVARGHTVLYGVFNYRLPDSHRATVERVTYIFSANACCDIPFSVRSFFSVSENN